MKEERDHHDISWRVLPTEEWERLEWIFEDRKWRMPDPNTSRVLVVEEDGEIAAMLVYERVLHIGPLYARPESRGRRYADLLAAVVRATFPIGSKALITTTNPHVDRLARRMGMIDMGRGYSLEMKEPGWVLEEAEEAAEEFVVAVGEAEGEEGHGRRAIERRETTPERDDSGPARESGDAARDDRAVEEAISSAGTG